MEAVLCSKMAVEAVTFIWSDRGGHPTRWSASICIRQRVPDKKGKRVPGINKRKQGAIWQGNGQGKKRDSPARSRGGRPWRKRERERVTQVSWCTCPDEPSMHTSSAAPVRKLLELDLSWSHGRCQCVCVSVWGCGGVVVMHRPPETSRNQTCLRPSALALLA